MALHPRHAAALCAALALVLAAPARRAHADDFEATVARAQRTLAQMVQVLDGIEARRARRGVGAPADEGWQRLFDGTSLAGWQRTAFTGGAAVRVEPSFRGGGPAIVVDAGQTLSGLNWTGAVPRTDFEISLETLKIKGNDFLCGLTFPVGESYASLILGGWGGGMVGISSIDGADASENETSQYRTFAPDRWYRVRMRVSSDRLEAWLDDEKLIDVRINGRRISLRRGQIDLSVPLGIATYQTSAAFRNIRLRRLPPL